MSRRASFGVREHRMLEHYETAVMRFLDLGLPEWKANQYATCLTLRLEGVEATHAIAAARKLHPDPKPQAEPSNVPHTLP